ncbi:MAG TPA: AAA family ATPase [Thermoanaerobaculia bacterium]|nr:AAA family ATPase [Thermoanaerobaculia bacterium]
MRIARLEVENFRGIRTARVLLPPRVVLVGDNNTGKSTLLEAIDLVLGPERLSRRPPVNEHDFYAGTYIRDADAVPIRVEVVVTDLNDDQTRHFRDHLEWWDTTTQTMIEGPPERTDAGDVGAALRVEFRGEYDFDEDDFKGQTFYSSPVRDDGEKDIFRLSDKRLCGFLFLRTLRTGRRALSLERGSLLDVILRLQEKRLQMWEQLLGELTALPVGANPELGITELLAAVQESARSYVPSEWVDKPRMRVSELTRESLRSAVSVFMGTGALRDDGSEYSAPFAHQGTGTVNALVLALLSLIAELKQNVIFAMEEPEIAIPPHAQKRIVDSIRRRSAQAIFSSHSPYVLEEFAPEEVLVLRRDKGELVAIPSTYPPNVKPKQYREEFRKRFAEALLARHVLLAEGRTEYDALIAAARRLSELGEEGYKSLEAIGVAPLDAGGESKIAPLATHFASLGKRVFAVCDKQTEASRASIEASGCELFESPYEGFEELLVTTTAEAALRRFATSLVDGNEWPSHLSKSTPSPTMDLNALRAAAAPLRATASVPPVRSPRCSTWSAPFAPCGPGGGAGGSSLTPSRGAPA